MNPTKRFAAFRLLVIAVVVGVWSGAGESLSQSTSNDGSASEPKEPATPQVVSQSDERRAIEIGRKVMSARYAKADEIHAGVPGVTLKVSIAEAVTNIFRKDEILNKLELVLRRNKVPLLTNGTQLTFEMFGVQGKDTRGGTVDFVNCTADLKNYRLVLCPSPSKYFYIWAPVWGSTTMTLYGKTNLVQNELLNGVEKLAEEFAVAYLRGNDKQSSSR
jgi:hypothetical protein